MKRVGVLFLILCFFFLGMIIGKPTRETASSELEDKIEDFEKNITSPNNDYVPSRENNIEPNLSNSMAKKGEDIINGFFNIAFKVIKNILD